jgi:hypothetical protein
MIRRVFLDIETLPPDEDVRRRISPAMIRKLARQRRADDGAGDCTEEQFRRLALHGEYGRVLTIALTVEHDDQLIHRGLLGRERQTSLFHLDEGRTLRAFWKLMRDFKTSKDIVIGHNVLNFDLPFLYKRSYVHGVKPTVELSFARYRNQPVFDTMQVWSGWDYRSFLSLSDLGGVLGVGAKMEGMNGGCVYDCIINGEHDMVARYALQDVELVRAIYYRMTAPGGFVPNVASNDDGGEGKDDG